MLRSSLRGLGGESLCRSVGVDPFSRAETVSVDAFLDLAAAVASA
jgi:16S rRNA A1518/A1519 N6-dimethyltransferase RsmA/KsgA/DIM1 with predicted DNA glycosylase/AP lyase activity